MAVTFAHPIAKQPIAFVHEMTFKIGRPIASVDLNLIMERYFSSATFIGASAVMGAIMTPAVALSADEGHPQFGHALQMCREQNLLCGDLAIMYKKTYVKPHWSRNDLANMVEYNLSHGNWEAAKNVAHSAKAGRESQIRVFPTVEGSHSRARPTAYNFDFKHMKLNAAPLPMGMDGKPILIIKFSPLCHFCQNAAHDLLESADRIWVEKCSIWAATLDGNFDMRDFAKWRQTFPEFPLALVQDWQSHGLSSVFETPVFYIVQRGVIMKEFVGWPRDGSQRDALRTAMRMADETDACGVAPAATPPASAEKPPDAH